jgi:hypothetical protein
LVIEGSLLIMGIHVESLPGEDMATQANNFASLSWAKAKDLIQEQHGFVTILQPGLAKHHI